MVIGRLRALNDAANAVLGFLGTSDSSAGRMEAQLQGSAATLAQVSQFVEALPEVLRGKLEAVHEAAIQEIGGLAGLINVIKDITAQTKVLAVNASIMAATAGVHGRGFAVVAKEVRALSDQSAKAATMIEKGLEDAQGTMRLGLATGLMNEEIMEARTIVQSMHDLQRTNEEVRQYYRNLLGTVTEQNQRLAAEITEILGQLQGQDVVRQRLERMLTGMAHRNAVLGELPATLDAPEADLDGLAIRMRSALDHYLQTEQDHSTDVGDSSSSGLARIELF
jgi:methyl-accepting chemotaxis protein